MPLIYEFLPGYFAHDDEEKPHVAVPPRFGLKDTAPDRWTSFFDRIRNLNKDAPEGTSYKFFLLSRHGQGYHNLAEAKYGTDAWDEYWSKLEGDGEIVWGPDPQLTPLGISQAHDIQVVWKTEALAGLFPPHRRYCSPLTRALDTCDGMLDGVFEAHRKPVLILELCREENGVHTCDKRKSRSYIAAHKPHFDIEEGLSEEDELWHATIRETKPEVAQRARIVLDTIFESSNDDIFVSITAHGGWINGFLTAIGRGIYPLKTGGVLPVIVKAQR
ncbi:hypothetical protein HYPSUDRAFT_48179 [Hypholoma sublateritium FD-334 SS-4]|uniref:Phosphoglycerate mutase-like protein n=1 Tax=Hypholoma sublateritium (strain FD-334 SS-4) TaxID=945553 RepID=A0A0D2N957_HYPSF|nr:hypothetical protein HYPSUDRAFT_48179 [Hypholoma sublateritium FD-334 SS-4]